MKTWRILGRILAGMGFLLCAGAARAEIAVSANDGKQLLSGDAGVIPDSVTVLDIGPGNVKVVGSLAVPAAMIGPPRAVAVAADGKLAIVTACQSLVDGALAPADTVSVLDLSAPAHPRLLQSLHAGPGASGVSISPNGRLALVANAEDNSISIFSIAGKRLRNEGKVALGDKTGPTDVLFTRDGKSAIAVEHGAVSRLAFLSVEGSHVALTGKAIAAGRLPYGAVVTRDNRYVINTNVGGAMPLPGEAKSRSRTSTVVMTDIASGAAVASVDVGPVSEHVTLSADGKYALVVVANGAATVRSDPKYDRVLGLLEIYAVGDGTLTEVARADTCHWSQGATFSRDGKTILLQCATEREIEVFHFDGAALTRDKGATMVFAARPGSIATASSR